VSDETAKPSAEDQKNGNGKSWRLTSLAIAAMAVVGGVAVLTRDVAIISAISGVLTTILGMVAQRHTAADLYASTPAPGYGRKEPPAKSSDPST
jgi:hypothetical protein